MSARTEGLYRGLLVEAGLLDGDPISLPDADVVRAIVMAKLPEPRHVQSSVHPWMDEVWAGLARGAGPTPIWDRLPRLDPEFIARVSAMKRRCRRRAIACGRWRWCGRRHTRAADRESFADTGGDWPVGGHQRRAWQARNAESNREARIVRSNGGGARAPRSQVPATATNTPPAQRSGPTGRGGGVAAFTSHDLRRSYIADPLGAGADLPTVQQIVGYADPATVQQIVGYADPATAARYDRRAAKARKKAASLLNVPYGGYGNQRLFRRPSAWRRRPL